MRGRLSLGVAAAAVAGVAAAGSAVALLATAAWLIATAAGQPPVLTLMVAIVAVRAFGLGRGVLRYAERLLAHDVAFRRQAELRVTAYRRLERLAPEGLSEYRSGDLLSRLVSDVDAVLDRIVRVLLPFTVAAVAGAATAALLALVLPVAGAAAAIGLGCALVVVPWLVSLAGHRAQQAVAPERGALAAQVKGVLDGAGELLAYDGTTRALAEVEAASTRLREAEAAQSWRTGLGNGLLVLVIGGISLAGLGFGVPLVRSGALGQVLLAVVTLTPLALVDVLGGIPLAAAVAGRVRPALARVGAVMIAPDPVPEPAHPGPLPEPPYHLRVEGVGVPGRLAPLDLDLPPGAGVVLAGPSGSGKTTLAQVLVRLLEPASGRVRLNGVDVRDLAGDDVRRVVKLCEQEAHVFDTTLLENVRLARPAATDAEIRDALRRARLLDWASALPDGLATRVGEHGERLSGGERRRLALARCLLADAPVLIFDEPTEHLDDRTAGELTEELLALAPERTVLLITHRATTRLNGCNRMVNVAFSSFSKDSTGQERQPRSTSSPAGSWSAASASS
ncbi:amino acid ABC transporter ATP-binding/permease protein [Flindersiella endophytica]